MKEKIAEAIAGLKDFQLKTVEYAIDQLYLKNKNKILIADEVGLGKTIVAKGIIAKAFEKYLNEGGPTKQNPTFNVIYICSNLALAKQNIRKLNFLGSSQYVDETVNRLTYLAYEPREKPPAFLIQALTPGTSFDEKSHMGEVGERSIIFALLAHYSSFFNRKEGLMLLLKGGITNTGYWFPKFIELYTNRKMKIRRDLFAKFRKELLEYTVTPGEMPRLYNYMGNKPGLKLWKVLKKVCGRLRVDNYDRFDFKSEIIKILRRILSKLCLHYLGADIFILDEFQRYNNLIKLDEEAESPAIETARTVFRIPDAKTLMLSATPFKPYTNDFDELNGEVHYKEFVNVLKFLLGEKPGEFWKEFENNRQTLFNYLRHPQMLNSNFSNALSLKNTLEEIYRGCIVRTEKMLASKDPNALIELVDKKITLQPEDINDFISLDQVTLYLNENYKAALPAPLEYVKSSPFAMSFLDNYQHKRKIRRYIAEDEGLRRLVRKTNHGWLNFRNINQYKPLIPSRGNNLPNAKLRLLFDETISKNGWKYLWIPPSILYYPLDGAFKDAWGFSKSLIFSSWKLVPRMISTLVSYEAERLSIGNLKAISERERKERSKKDSENIRYNYFEKPRSPRPQFTFKVLKDAQEPQQMNNFILAYPSVYLTKFYDPVLNLSEGKTLNQLIRELKEKFTKLFYQFDLNQYVSGEGDWQRWYWLAPLFLDKATDTESDKTLIRAWFRKGIPHSELSIDAENRTTDRDESTGKEKHFEFAASTFLNSELFPAAKLNDAQIEKIGEYLAVLTISSPAVCFLRTLLRYHSLSTDLLDASFNTASGFMTLFNKPESIAIVRFHHKEGDYRERALRYMADGNVQSMLDEFVYLLINSENIRLPAELSDFITEILSVRTSTIDIEDYRDFMDKPHVSKRKRKSMRSHYAVDFGIQKMSTASKSNRDINIRQAFNSPFRPFVLASTSIGQEGLDFHFYCKKIFHWNLPSNAIDFEQREGRIHRYQGLVIRLNLSDKYANKVQVNGKSNNVWEEIMAIASEEKYQAKFPCELVPFWHTESQSDIKIERFVPLYPFSRDIEKYNNIIKILAFYRLTFGQPRQQELVEALQDTEYSQEEFKKMEELIIDLSPIKFLRVS